MSNDVTEMMSSLTSRVLVACGQVPEPVEGAGVPPARCWSLAETLAESYDIILAVPAITELSHKRFAVVYFTGRNIRLVARDSDVVVCDAAVLAQHPHLLDSGKPLAIDLAGSRPPEPGDDENPLVSVLRTGDFFFCATEEERRNWLPALERAARVNPHTLEGDSGLRELIDVARPPDRLQPIIDYCAVPRFARDRGTGYSGAGLPAAEQGAVWSRAAAAIKRKIFRRQQT